MRERLSEILTHLRLNLGKDRVEMPLGGATGPCKHYRRLALKHMEDAGLIRTHRGRYDPQEGRVTRPSSVVVLSELEDKLAAAAMPDVSVGRPKHEVLHDLNRFYAEHDISGCPQVKLGFHRIDKDGERYGRMHAACAHGTSYQTMKAEERAKIRIDGKPTVEIDLNASQVRIQPATSDQLDAHTIGGVC
jgi:hypothetical protein